MLFRVLLFSLLGSFLMQLKSSKNTQVKHSWVFGSIHCIYYLFWTSSPCSLAPLKALNFKFSLFSPVRLSGPLDFLPLGSVLLPRFLDSHLHQNYKTALSRNAAYRIYQLTCLLLYYFLLSEMYAPFERGLWCFQTSFVS